MSLDYGFLAEPLSSQVGYSPAQDGAPVGTFIEPVLKARFGEWDIAANDDEDLVALERVHASCVRTWRATVEAIEQVRTDDDPALNADARLKIVAQLVEPKMQRLATEAAAELERAEGSLATVRADIGKVCRIADATDLSVHEGIRAHLKSLGGGLSIAAVAQAIADRDALTLQAVAVAPHFMSGLPAPGADVNEWHAKACAALAELKAPALVARASQLEAGIAKDVQALKTLNQFANRTIDFKKAQKLRERSKSYAPKDSA